MPSIAQPEELRGQIESDWPWILKLRRDENSPVRRCASTGLGLLAIVAIDLSCKRQMNCNSPSIPDRAFTWV
jgi:hypothetical protein